MSLDADFFAFLTGDTTFFSIVQNRIFPDLMPEGTPFPAAVYKSITNTSIQTLGGSSGLDFGTVQIDVYAKTRAAVMSAKVALYNKLVGFRGQMGGTYVGGIMHVNDSAGFETDTRLYRATIEIEIWHNL